MRLNREKHLFFFLIPGLVTSAIFFQNCSGPQIASSVDETIVAKSNGGGYDGKLTQFLHLNRAEPCADGGAQSAVVIHSDQTAKLVRENCQELSPTPLGSSEFQVAKHNLGFASMGTKLYQEEVVAQENTEIFCRSEDVSVSLSKDTIDLWINRKPEGQLQGRIKIGRYSLDGQLIEVVEDREFLVQRAPLVFASTRSYLAPNFHSNRSFLLNINTDSLAGQFASANAIPVGVKTVVREQAGVAFVQQMVKCAAHSNWLAESYVALPLPIGVGSASRSALPRPPL